MRLSNDVIDDFKQNYVSSDNIGTSFLVLLALHKGDYDFLDKLDDSNKDKKMILLYRDLVYKGYLTENEDNDDQSNVHFSLTPKSIRLIESVNEGVDEKLYEEQPVVLKSKQQEFYLEEKVVDDNAPVEIWIKDWLKLWPTKRADGTLIRSGSGVCKNKMNIFVKNNPEFTKEVIYAATRLYLEGEAERGWQYTNAASNFISKQEAPRSIVRDSKLEAYCNLVLSGEETNKTKYSDLRDDDPFV